MKLELITPVVTTISATAPTINKNDDEIKFIADYVHQNNTSIDKIDLEKFKEEFLIKFPDKASKVENLNNENISEAFKSHLKTIKSKIKESLKSDYSKREHNKNVKRIYTDLLNKYMVNDDGQISSKNILSKIEELINFYEDKKNSLDKLTRIVNGLTGVSITLKWICGTASFVSALSTISTFFTFGTTSGIAGVAGIVALVSGVLSDVLDGIVHYYKTELKNTQKMIELVNTSRQYTPHFLIEKFVKAGADVAYYVGEKLLTKSIKEFAKLMKYADVINSFKTGVDSFKDSINGILYLADINKESKKSNEKLVGIASQISKMKKVKWTVLHESPLDRHYILGGAGGINQIFKNIETGQILGLDEMLQYSKFELYSMGLTKALHPKTGWYIRTLPNDTKIDNLG